MCLKSIVLSHHWFDIGEGVFHPCRVKGIVMIDDVAAGAALLKEVKGLATRGAVATLVFLNTINQIFQLDAHASSGYWMCPVVCSSRHS